MIFTSEERISSGILQTNFITEIHNTSYSFHLYRLPKSKFCPLYSTNPAWLDNQKRPLPPWGLAVAGATGAVIANAMVYPLDIVKTRLQVQVKRKPTDVVPAGVDAVHYTSTWDAISKIVAEDGVAGLYAGINGALIGSLQPILPTSTGTQSFEPYISLPKSEDGWSGLWRGLKASLVLVVNPAITYGAYQRLREVVFPGKTNLQALGSICIGGNVSKSLATIVNTASNRCKGWTSVKTTPLPRRTRVLGLFKGIGPQITKGLIVQGLLMMTKERMELLFILLFRYLRKIKSEQLQKAADLAASKAKQVLPVIAK
ncbi:hypothetical protein DID88_009908 [Monilinia fructigena]|uniref:Mitochondrial carrier protein n=1 Tax=Monilinia fructigena TaxID=38457 RepID=A0A395IN36_9HELO|nr:hypothetical protein DID88_009908 [Monilinia fructigena]